MTGLDRMAEPGEDEVGRAGRPGSEDADGVEPAVGGQRADDPRAGGAVAADVTRIVVDDRNALTVSHDGPGAHEVTDERVARLDPAVDDAHVDSAARPTEGPLPRHGVPPCAGRLHRRRLAGRQAPRGNGPGAHVEARATSRAAVAACGREVGAGAELVVGSRREVDVDEAGRCDAGGLGEGRGRPGVGANGLLTVARGERGEGRDVRGGLGDAKRDLRSAAQRPAQRGVSLGSRSCSSACGVGAMVVVCERERAIAERGGLGGDPRRLLPVVRDACDEADEARRHRRREGRGRPTGRPRPRPAASTSWSLPCRKAREREPAGRDAHDLEAAAQVGDDDGRRLDAFGAEHRLEVGIDALDGTARRARSARGSSRARDARRAAASPPRPSPGGRGQGAQRLGDAFLGCHRRSSTFSTRRR